MGCFLSLQNLAYEIILTLGQAFEVAYQLALQARKGGHSSTLPESFDSKPTKPIPKPRVSIRKATVSNKTLPRMTGLKNQIKKALCSTPHTLWCWTNGRRWCLQ